MSKRTNYIYTLTDPVNNIVAYIGESVTPETREKQHQSEASHPVNYFPFLNFPVTSTTFNWKQWLGYMGITPVMTIIDSFYGTKRDARKLERQYIAEYTKKGVRLCNDYKPAKELPCPYASIWLRVWQRYELLKAKPVKAEDRFPAIISIDNDLIQQCKILDAIRNRLRIQARDNKRNLYKLASEIDQRERDKAYADIVAMFASERAISKTIPLLPAPKKKAS